MKSKKGITLIALVITIIVLLILAGVSISLVVGDNGVLTQATNAVSKNREATALEDVQMAWASATSEYWTDWATNSSTNLADYRKKAKLDPYLVGKGHLEGEPRYNETDKEYTIHYRAIDQNELYTFLITEDGNARKKTGIAIEPNELYLLPGGSAQLTASFIDMPEGDITWTSNGNSGITVDDSGTVSIASTLVTGDNAVITASYNGTSDTCYVEVVELLSSKVSVGSYVNINVGYNKKNGSGSYTGNDIGKAWKVKKINTSSGEIYLISNDCPLKFRVKDNATLAVTEMKKISNESITVNSSCEMGYTENGFNTNDVKSLFSNEDIFTGMKPLEVGASYYGFSQTASGWGCPENLLTNTYGDYWFAYAASNKHMYVHDSRGYYGVLDVETYPNYVKPVRIVVGLKAGLTILDGTGEESSPFRLREINY